MVFGNRCKSRARLLNQPGRFALLPGRKLLPSFLFFFVVVVMFL